MYNTFDCIIVLTLLLFLIVALLYCFKGLTASNPQWIGAWWLGLVIISGVLMAVSLPMLLFPATIPPPDHFHTDAEVRYS